MVISKGLFAVLSDGSRRIVSASIFHHFEIYLEKCSLFSRLLRYSGASFFCLIIFIGEMLSAADLCEIIFLLAGPIHQRSSHPRTTHLPASLSLFSLSVNTFFPSSFEVGLVFHALLHQTSYFL